MNLLKAHIVDIKKFAVHDGDGIRTTIFFKGCPLSCVWCHNPEGISSKAETAYFEGKCINCGACGNICSANKISSGRHIFSRELCKGCGICVDICPMTCFRRYGNEYTVSELLEIILEDKTFYDQSGGGVTLSGGECLMQADFSIALLDLCHKNGINTAIDTCGYVSQEIFTKISPFTDTFLYDIKAIDEDVHIRCTGRSNKLILNNLVYLDSINKKCEIRYPYVPGFNSNQAEKIASFLSNLKHKPRLKILPFHNLSKSKYLALGLKEYIKETKVPTAADLNKAVEIFNKYGIETI